MHQKITLENGLRVILIPRKSNDTMTAIIGVRAGSADESDEIAGISHLLEHMLGMGSKKRPTQFEVSDYIESIGGMDNAFTSKIYTGYYAKVAKEFWKESLDFLSDNFFHALMLEDKIEREKDVIVEEIKMHDDIMADVASNKFAEAAFGKTPMGRDIAGSKESVKALTKRQLLEYYHTHYTPKNTVLALAGNWQTTDEEILKFIEDNFAFGKNYSDEIVKPEFEIKPLYLRIDKREAEQTNLLVGFKAPSLEHPDWYAMQLLAKIIGGGAASRMFQEVREKRGLAYDVRTGLASFIGGAGELGTIAGVSNDKWYEAIEAIIDVYSTVSEKGVTAAELQKAKNMIRGAIMIDIEDTEELAWEYCSNELLLHETVSPEETLQRFEKVEISDIVRVAKEYLLLDKIMIGAVGPTLDEAKLARFVK